MIRTGTRGVAKVVWAALAIFLFAPRAAHAEADPAHHPPLIRLSLGPVFEAESWSAGGGAPGASYAGWGPAVDLTVGRAVDPRWTVAGDLQVSGLIDRTETYQGQAYALNDTLHVLTVLGALAELTPARHPQLHVAAALGGLAVADADTHMGGVQYSWGLAASLQAGADRPLSRRWSVGIFARPTVTWFWTDTPSPPSRSWGLAATLLLSFTRR